MIIEKGIPIPVKNSGIKSKYEIVFAAMIVGDSVLFKGNTGANGFMSAAKRLGVKVTQRTVSEGIRVWKIE